MATKIKPGYIDDNAVGTAQIADNSITAAKIAAGVLTDQIAGISSSADATAITIDSSENVGIGTSSPSRLLTLSGTASPYIALASNTTGGSPALFFGDSEDDNEGRITYSNSQDYMSFSTATEERMRIDSSGNVQITSSDDTRFDVVDTGDSSTFRIRGDGANTSIGNTTNHPVAFITNNVERMRIDSSGRVGINRTPAITNAKLEVGGADNVPLINVEASGTTGGIGIGDASLKFYHGTSEKLRITSGGELKIPSHSGYELSFTGSDTVNLRSDNGLFILYNHSTSPSDPYFGIGPESYNALNMMARYKTSTGTLGSAATYAATAFGNSNGQTALGNWNGIEPMAPFHILKGGLTMNGGYSGGTPAYAHGNSDTGQWMHMNSCGRAGSGVSQFIIEVPTAQSGSSWGGFAGEVLLSGYNGAHSFIIFRGYTNGGVAGGAAFQVSGSGSPTLTVTANGLYGFKLTVTNISMTHPIAMYKVCKGGNSAREWDLSEIYAKWG